MGFSFQMKRRALFPPPPPRRVQVTGFHLLLPFNKGLNARALRKSCNQLVGGSHSSYNCNTGSDEWSEKSKTSGTLFAEGVARGLVELLQHLVNAIEERTVNIGNMLLYTLLMMILRSFEVEVLTLSIHRMVDFLLQRLPHKKIDTFR